MKKILFLFFITSSILFIGCSKKAESKPFYNEEEIELNNESKTEIVETDIKTEADENNDVYQPYFSVDLLEEYRIFPIKEGEENKLGENYYYHPLPAIYVLGFSQDGKIIWCDSRFIDGRGDYVFTLYVQDLVSDDILETLSLSSEDNASSESDISKAFFNTYASVVEGFAQKYKIKFGQNKMEYFPGKIGNVEYNAEVSVKDTGKLVNEYFKVIDYSCVIEKVGQGKKSVTSKKDYLAENAVAAGFVKSPWEERIAVIIAEAIVGFEGIDIYYSFSGCDLNKNF